MMIAEELSKKICYVYCQFFNLEREIAMRRASLICVALLTISVVLAGCAGSGPIGTSIPQSERMTQHPQDDRALLYVNTEAPKKSWSKFIVEPVQIYQGADNGFGDISTEDRQMMADYTRSEVIRVLGERYAIVDKPGPDTMRIKLILVGLEKTNTVMRGLTYGNPMGLAMNLGKGALGKQGNFMGSVTLAGEFEDAEAGTTLAASMGKINPFALSPSFTPWDAAKAGIKNFASDFRDRMDRNRGAAK